MGRTSPRAAAEAATDAAVQRAGMVATAAVKNSGAEAGAEGEDLSELSTPSLGDPAGVEPELL
jgi:hypothetical protein